MRSQWTMGLLVLGLTSLSGLAFACEETALTPGTDSAQTPVAQEPGSSTEFEVPAGDMEMAIALVDAHNVYREEVGVPPLTWSETLAASAQAYAEQLASTDTFEHSDGDGYGENLWKGTAGFYSLEDMVNAWGDEKQYFIPDAVFPEVSTTGNWGDVGHYTQMIWRDTTEVGCGLATGNGWDVLVCQYSPPGNYLGQQPL